MGLKLCGGTRSRLSMTCTGWSGFRWQKRLNCVILAFRVRRTNSIIFEISAGILTLKDTNQCLFENCTHPGFRQEAASGFCWQTWEEFRTAAAAAVATVEKNGVETLERASNLAKKSARQYVTGSFPHKNRKTTIYGPKSGSHTI